MVFTLCNTRVVYLLTSHQRRLGKKLCLFAEYAGNAALLFLILGPPSDPNYSVGNRYATNFVTKTLSQAP